MKKQSFLMMGALMMSGCASIPAHVAAKKWVGRAVSDAVSSFGEPRDTRNEAGGRTAQTWRFERFVDEVVPTGTVLGRDAGGRPTLFTTHDTRRVKFACDLTLVSERNVVVDARPRPVAGVGPGKAGGCDGHGI